jgi:hypothetical protein
MNWYIEKQRHQKIAFMQQQLNLLQSYGEYGYEVLEALRDRIKLLNTTIEESWQDGAFVFTYRNRVACSYHWQDEDMVQVVLYDKVQDKVLQFVHEYKKGKKIEWAVITAGISHYIRELESVYEVLK